MSVRSSCSHYLSFFADQRDYRELVEFVEKATEKPWEYRATERKDRQIVGWTPEFDGLNCFETIIRYWAWTFEDRRSEKAKIRWISRDSTIRFFDFFLCKDFWDEDLGVAVRIHMFVDWFDNIPILFVFILCFLIYKYFFHNCFSYASCISGLIDFGQIMISSKIFLCFIFFWILTVSGNWNRLEFQKHYIALH